MMDHHLFEADPWQTTFAATYASFFASAPAGADQFNLDGSVIRDNGNALSTGLLAQNATVGFGVPASDGTPFVRALWDVAIPTGQYRYYDGMLDLLASLHVSGRFKIW
jgi:oligosaccharide reducing-end xylanase